MFTNDRRQEERTGRSGTPRLQYLQELVTRFQSTTDDEEAKEKIVANLANFAYDPYNYAFLRQLNVLELFVDCITEPNEKLVEFGVGGICNCCADPANAAIIAQCGGISLVIQCLSSPVRNTESHCRRQRRGRDILPLSLGSTGLGSRNTYNNDSTNKKRRNLQARTRKIGPKED